MIADCPHCGLRHVLDALPRRTVARCARCAAFLAKGSAAPPDLPLALALAGLILVAIANFMPFLSLRIEGRVDEASLVTGAVALAEDGLWPLAALVIATTVAAPVLKLGGTAYVLASLKRRRVPRHVAVVFRWLDPIHPWAMLEVYFLGLLVAYVKLADLATMGVGVAVFALFALILVTAASDACLDRERVWREIAARGGAAEAEPASTGPLVRCHACALVSPLGAPGARCPRCGAKRHARRPDSVATTWALVIAALILYLPANLFPVMTVVSFGRGEPDTILSGVRHLAESGMWPLALLVFFASIAVPVIKLASLMLLLVATRRGARRGLFDRTLLYRIVEGIGRWSMIDIFVISVLVGLVRLGNIASITPGAGALSFAAVVVVTMFAAMSFDPRLMWDHAGANDSTPS